MKVLLAIDDSAHSTAAVEATAKRFDPKTTAVRVLHVVEWPQKLPIPMSFVEGPIAADSIIAAHVAMTHQGCELVARAAETLRSADFDVTTEIDEGDVRGAILRVAGEWPADLIVLGSHGRTGIGRFLLGSVSETVVRHAPCSVEVVRSASGSQAA